MATNQSLTFAKPVVIALFGPKGCGKTTAADMLGFPQYQFNQWAIEVCAKELCVPEAFFKDPEWKDSKNLLGYASETLTPRQFLINFIDNCLKEKAKHYIESNFAHFMAWLVTPEVQDSYCVTLPSIRREFELDYLTKLMYAGYEVVCVELEREGYDYSYEHETEMRLIHSATWRASVLYGQGYYGFENNTCPRELVNAILLNVSSELAERSDHS